jgi:hypothetical protein
MPKIARQHVQDNAINSDKVDESDNYTWAGRHIFNGPGNLPVITVQPAANPSGQGSEGMYVYGAAAGTGDSDGGAGIIAEGGAPSGSGKKGYGLDGRSSGNAGTRGFGDPGLKGESVNGNGCEGISQNGYGVVAESDTTTPAKAALRIVPQDANPTSPAVGDFRVDANGQLYTYTGTIWQRVARTPATVMHAVTAGEVTAGYFTLSTTPLDPATVKAWIWKGARQINKQTAGGIAGATADFDILSNNQFHINNNGAASGLSEEIVAGNVLVIDYEV